MSTLKLLVRVILSIVGPFVSYLLVVALIPGLTVPPQPIKPRKDSEPDDDREAVGRQDVVFSVGGALVSAWFYLPDNREGPLPCIIMAHGLGGTKDGGLAVYASRFRDAGYAVLVFDYRCFGRSGGEPRQLLWVPKQLEDWTAAVAYARSRQEIDPARIALWGTSFSGGHVVVTAARDSQIACISAQCPSMDGRANVLKLMRSGGLASGLTIIMHGQRDLVRSWLGLSPHKIPIAGRPGSTALLDTADSFEGYSLFAPDGFVNEVCARIAIRADKYRPIVHARHVRCPALFQICEQDSLIDNRATEETARQMAGEAKVIHYPIRHFDIYVGDHLERALCEQIAFFGENL